jgi:sulfur-oxidizing protein SoxZ
VDSPRSVRALLHVPALARVGEGVEIRAHIQHAMETGYRVGAEGEALPRDLVRRVECRFDGELVFAADLHAAIAANPYLAFWLRAQRSGMLTVTWQGDGGLLHRESARLTVA